MRKLTYNDVKKFVEENSNCKLISKEYINQRSKMKFQCKCGNIFEVTFSSFKTHNKRCCNDCSFQSRISKRRMSYEEVKHYVEVESKSGCKLLSKTYVNQRTPLILQCKCGNQFETTLNSFKNMNIRNCKECGKQKLISSIKISFEETVKKIAKVNPSIEILDEFKKNDKYYLKCKCKVDGYEWESVKSQIMNGHSGCPKCAKQIKPTIDSVKQSINTINPNIEILSTTYVNNKTPLKCKCKIDNNIFYLCYSDLQNRHGCRECYLRNNIGEKHPRYNPNLTEEDRIRDRHDLYGANCIKLAKLAYKKDNYTCQCCGQYGGKLISHHLDGYNWCKEKRFDINNVVTLCEDCHKEFHRIYGYGNNTKEQFEEFLRNKNIKIG